MSGFYGIPGLQAVTDIGSSTSTAVTFNGAVDLNSNISVIGFMDIKTDFQVRGATYMNMGDSFETKIGFDGTNLILDGITTGFGARVFIGDGTTGGGLVANNIETFYLSLGTATPPTTTPLLQADATGTTVAGIISGNVEHTGSIATMRAMLMTAIHDGTAATQNVAGGYFSGQIKVKNSGTANVFGINGLAQLNGSIAIGAGTLNLQNKFEVTGSGGTHTGGTVYSRSLWATEPPTLTGVTSFTGWAGLFSGDTQINSNKKLLLEGSDTVKGDTYLIYDTASSELQMFVNNTKVLGSTSGTLTAYVSTSGFGGGGGGNSVTATVDFGASFTDKAEVVVTGQGWVTANTEIVAQLKTASGTDPDEIYLLEPEIVISDFVVGTGFTVTVYTKAEAKGTYDIMCIGV